MVIHVWGSQFLTSLTCLFFKILYMIQTWSINYWNKFYSFFIVSNYKNKLFFQKEWFVIFFSFVDDNQNPCGKFINVFMMQAVDHEWKISNDGPKQQHLEMKVKKSIFLNLCQANALLSSQFLHCTCSNC